MKLDSVPKCLAIKDGFREPVVREGEDSSALPSSRFHSWLIFHVGGAAGGAPDPICSSALIPLIRAAIREHTLKARASITYF